MIRKFLFAAVLGLFAVEVSAEEYLKNMDFSEGLASWLAPKYLNLPDGEISFKVIKADNGNQLFITGSKQEVCQMVQTINLSPEQLFKKRVTVSALIKPEKIASGSLQLMCREVDAAGKTIRYRSVKIDKWSPNEWKRYMISFEVLGKTKRVQIYIKSNYLSPGDKIFLKDMILKIH